MIALQLELIFLLNVSIVYSCCIELIDYMHLVTYKYNAPLLLLFGFIRILLEWPLIKVIYIQACVVQPKAEMDLQFESTKLSTPLGYFSAIALSVTTFGTIALMSGFFLKPDATFDDYLANVAPLFGGFLSILGVSEVSYFLRFLPLILMHKDLLHLFLNCRESQPFKIDFCMIIFFLKKKKTQFDDDDLWINCRGSSSDSDLLCPMINFF